MNLFDEILKEDYLCFDIGANKGRFVKMLLEHNVNKIVAVEPQILAFTKLYKRYYKNEKVVLINKGLDEKECKKIIKICEAVNTISTFSNEFITETSKERFKKFTWNKREKVTMTTLDNLIKEYGMPNFCKIDVEGFEKYVLKGLTKKISLLSIEFTPELRNNTYECMDYMLKISKKYLFNYSAQNSKKFQFETWLKFNDMKEFLDKITDRKRTYGDLYIRYE